jgi:hypothetical protein
VSIPSDAYFRIPPEQRAAEAVCGFHCPFCGALPGEDCHVRASKAREWPNQKRMKLHAECRYPSQEAEEPWSDLNSDHANPVDGKGLRAHHLWLLRRMLGNITLEDLATATVVSLVALLMPDHSRIVGGGDPDHGPKRSRDAAILRLVPRSSGDGGRDEQPVPRWPPQQACLPRQSSHDGRGARGFDYRRATAVAASVEARSRPRPVDLIGNVVSLAGRLCGGCTEAEMAEKPLPGNHVDRSRRRTGQS